MQWGLRKHQMTFIPDVFVLQQQKIMIDVYVNERKYHSFEIDEATTVANVCDRLSILTCSKRDPFWTIVEHIDKLNLGMLLSSILPGASSTCKA